MRVALLGSRSLGRAVLRDLKEIDGVEVCLIAYPGGDDGMMKTAGATSLGRLRSHVHWEKQPWALESRLEVANPDIVVAAHWHGYVTPRMLELAGEGVFAYHPSLLPRHRGIDAVKWTIEHKDPIAGGSVYKMDRGLDTGPVALQRWCHVDPEWTASDLWRERLFGIGVDLLNSTVKLARRGALRLKHQEERFATYEEPYATV